MKQFSYTVAQIKNKDGEFEPIPAIRGMTPYEIAKKNGFEGTEEEWYNLSFDEGWVTKYQELEANKADKSDVYTKDEIATTKTKQSLGLEEAAIPDDMFAQLGSDVKELRRLSENTVDLWNFKYSDNVISSNATNGAATISPNGLYVAIHDPSTAKMTLYRTEDMTEIGVIDTNIYGASIQIDDNFGVVYYSNSNNINYPSYSLKFFEYDDSIREVEIEGSPTDCITYGTCAPIGTGDSNVFWFMSSQYDSGTYRTTYRVHAITKSSKSCITVKEYTLGGSSIAHRVLLYRDGTDAIVVTTTYNYSGSNAYISDMDVVGYRVSTDGSENVLFAFENTVTSADLPVPIYLGVDMDSSRVVMSGNYWDSTNSSYITPSTVVYDFDGNMICSKSAGYASPNSIALNGVCTVANGYLYVNNICVDLDTLEETSSVEIYTNATKPLQFNASYSACPISLVNNLFITTPSASGVTIIRDGGDITIGGYRNE